MNPVNIYSIVVKDRARQLDQDNVDELKDGILVDGLIQPIIVRVTGDEVRLVAGEHRLESFKQLHKTPDIAFDKYEVIPCISLEESLIEQGVLSEGETLSEADLVRYELEENVKRLGMNWQDKVIATARYHKLSENEASKRGESWTQSMTGNLMGIKQAHVSRVLVVAKKLRASKDDPLWQCESLTHALHALVKERQTQVASEQLRRMRARKEQVQAKVPNKAREVMAQFKAEGAAVDAQDIPALGDLPELDQEPESYSKADILELYLEGDCLDVLPNLAKMQTIHHIVTDPPYAIEMSNLDMKNLEDVEHNHKVEENIPFLLKLLEVAFDVIEEKGFMCMWYDLEHHGLLQAHAKKVGWKVCRWPFHWVKNSPCRNQSAAYNFTKSVEHCMILRKSGDAVLMKKQPDNFIVAPSSNSTAHPFHKPQCVWERLIEAISIEGQTIVDVCAGSGSCLNAGLQMNRDMIGIEDTPEHIHTGVEYLHQSLNAGNSFLTNVI